MPYGAIIGAISSAAQAGAAAIEGKKQRKFVKQQTSTVFQRGRKDLEAAGYNPLLALGGPGGGVASAGGAPVGNVGIPNLGDFSGAARGLNQFVERKKAKAETSAIEQAERTARSQEWKNQQDATVGMATHRKVDMEAKLLSTELSGAKAMEALDKTKTGEILRQIKRIKEAVNPLSGNSSRSRGGR